jgi:hypothetical protein
VADLGKVYTGLPWRKIRLQPQPASEQPNIPDWVMMDIFDFGNGSRTETPVNLNSLVVANGVAITRRNSGVRSLLQVLSNRGALTSLADPRNPTAASVSQRLSNSELNDIDLAASGINDLANRLSQPSEAANWSNSNSQQWFGRREVLRFPRDGFLLPSEVTEIAGIADFINISTAPNNNNVRFKANEQRLAALFPMLQTRGRFFTIYAIGEAMEGDEVVATRYLNTLVQVDNTANPPMVRKILQQPY